MKHPFPDDEMREVSAEWLLIFVLFMAGLPVGMVLAMWLS